MRPMVLTVAPPTTPAVSSTSCFALALLTSIVARPVWLQHFHCTLPCASSLRFASPTPAVHRTRTTPAGAAALAVATLSSSTRLFRPTSAASAASSSYSTRTGRSGGSATCDAPKMSSTAETDTDAAIASSSTAKADGASAAEGAKKKKLEDHSEAYAELVGKLRTITQLNRVNSVLGYDRVVFMPQNDRTSAERGAQLSALAGLIHEKTTDKSILDLIEKSESDLASLKGEDDDFADEARLLEIEKKAFLENERIPSSLAAKKAALSSAAYSAWVKAREADDFASFESTLRECFDVAMQVADAKRGEDAVPLYTQMLDEYEVGMSRERIDELFAEIKSALVPLIARVLASPHKPSTAALGGKKFPIEGQKEVSRRIVTSLGYDDTMGRIDVSVHPFTSSSSPSDVRITSRFSEDEWYQGLAGTVHEGGHAMYEQNLPSSALAIDTALSMGTHESQSLFWERHIGLSRPYWRYIAPILREKFPDFDHTPEELYGAANAVSPSLIRVEADELTYPLHVILRYEIEKGVIGGDIDVKDIPSRWNSAMKELLDVDVPSDAKGCLQDVHWSALAFGYFPTYLIGSSAAAQLAHYCRLDIPDLDEKIEQGDYAPIKAWLNEKVHRHGSRYKSLDAMLEDQVGEKLNPSYFIQYLTEKYTELYQC